MSHSTSTMDERPAGQRKPTPPRCYYCKQIHTGGVSCNSVRGDWVGQNATGGAKPPRKTKESKSK